MSEDKRDAVSPPASPAASPPASPPDKRDATTRVDLEGEDVHWDLKGRSSYGDYLRLGDLLAAQKPRSQAHDEMMFVVVHQVSELWLKLMIHEVGRVLSDIRTEQIARATKGLCRVVSIQRQLTDAWTIVSTMTPVDYASFRDSLGEASGFQSHQYRIVEFALGNKNAAMAAVHKHRPEVLAEVEQALRAPSLYDEVLQHLARCGIDVPPDKLARDWSQPYESDEGVERAWAAVYGDPSRYWELYELAEKLVDVEDNFHQWRFRHMKTVSRIIGSKRGTGGTSGVSYLEKALELRFFPELWSVRTRL